MAHGTWLLVAGAVIAAVGGGGEVARGGTPAAGLYTAQQAGEGEAIYAERCAMCHGPALEGTFETPALTGRFVANWARRPAGDLYAYLARAMPQFAPGSLSTEDDARLVAFILARNGYPAGPVPLAERAPGVAGGVLGPPGPNH